MKVCLVNSFYPPFIGGAETYASNLAKGLTACGNKVTVYCASTPLDPGEYMEEGIRVRRMRAPLRLYGTPIAVSPINLFAEDYDVIHCNFPSPYLASLFSYFSSLRRIPAVLTWHNDLPPVTSPAGLLVKLHNMTSSAYLRRFKRIIATTRVYAEGSPILSRWRDRVVVIHNGVDTGRFKPSNDGSKVRERHGLDGKKVVLFVGALTRWHAYKGLDNLIRAFSTVAGKDPDARLLVVGGGELAAANAELAKSLGIWNKVTFAGTVPDALLPSYYAACDLFVLPSRDRSEGYGLALLEAMATGKPVIGSQVGGIPEVINNGVTGLLVSPNQPVELATAILALLSDGRRRLSLGAKARQYAEENDWRRVAAAVAVLYGEIRI